MDSDLPILDFWSGALALDTVIGKCNNRVVQAQAGRDHHQLLSIDYALDLGNDAASVTTELFFLHPRDFFDFFFTKKTHLITRELLHNRVVTLTCWANSKF